MNRALLYVGALACLSMTVVQNKTNAYNCNPQTATVISWVCITNNFDQPCMLLLMPQRAGTISRKATVLLPGIIYPPQPAFAPFLFLKLSPRASAVLCVNIFEANRLHIVGPNNLVAGIVEFNAGVSCMHVVHAEIGQGESYHSGIKLTPVSQTLINAIDAAPTGTKPTHELLGKANTEEILV